MADHNDTGRKAEALVIELVDRVESILKPSSYGAQEIRTKAALTLWLTSKPDLRAYLDRARAIADEVRTRSQRGPGGPFVKPGGRA